MKLEWHDGQRRRPVESSTPRSFWSQTTQRVVMIAPPRACIIRVSFRAPGGASCLAASMTWVANSASVPLDSLDLPSLNGPLHRGQLTTFFPCEMDITVNDIWQAGQVMILFCCRERRACTCLN